MLKKWPVICKISAIQHNSFSNSHSLHFWAAWPIVGTWCPLILAHYSYYCSCISLLVQMIPLLFLTSLWIHLMKVAYLRFKVQCREYRDKYYDQYIESESTTITFLFSVSQRAEESVRNHHNVKALQKFNKRPVVCLKPFLNASIKKTWLKKVLTGYRNVFSLISNHICISFLQLSFRSIFFAPCTRTHLAQCPIFHLPHELEYIYPPIYFVSHIQKGIYPHM